LSALLAANLVGAVEVIAVDSNPDKFEVGSRLGRLEQSGPGKSDIGMPSFVGPIKVGPKKKLGPLKIRYAM
jgi:hypothetical protein